MNKLQKYFIALSVLTAVAFVSALWITGNRQTDEGATAANCTPTSQLVNPCRPWLGAAVGGYNMVASDLNSQMNFFNKRLNNPNVLNNASLAVNVTKKMDMAHVYHSQGSNLFNGSAKAVLNNSQIPYVFVNWKPMPSGYKWKDVGGNNATVNNYIKAGAEAVKALGSRKIILSVWHEPENDVSVGNCAPNASGASMGSPAEYVAMWKNVDKIFREQQVQNVVWAMNYMGFPKWDCLVPQLWPGNDIVDWVVYDQYGSGSKSFVQSVKPFYEYLTKNSNAQHDYLSKPWGLAEHGYGNAGNTSTEAGSRLYWQQGKQALLDNSLPRIKMWLVFDISISDYTSQVGLELDKETVSIPEQTAFNDFASTMLAMESTPSTPPTPPAPTPDTTKPSVPANLRATAQTSSSVTLAWGASTDNIGVEGYRIRRNGTEIAKVSQTTYTDKNLAANTAYSYTVEAYDAAGNYSAQTASLNVKTTQPVDTDAPSAPTNVRATAQSATRVAVTWSAAVDDVGVTGYVVQRNGITVGKVGGQALNYADASVLPQTAYTYRARAIDAAGNISAVSNEAQVTTPAAPDTAAPSTPANLTASIVGQQVNVTWSASSDNVAVKDYIVYRNNAQFTTATATNIGDATVQRGQSYSYSVAARDAAGNVSAKAAAVNVTVPVQVSSSAHQPGLAATYFANKDLNGTGVSRTDTQVNFDWKGGAPVAGVQANNFSARWTGRVTPTHTGTYTFFTQADDGVRLWVNNRLLIDDWGTHSVTERSGSIVLTKGMRYNIKLEYFEAGGNATVKLLWQSANNSKQIIPSSQLVTSSYGLTGSYYNGTAFNSLIARRIDPKLDFVLGRAAPMQGVPADDFSARWTGQLFADHSETYTFYTKSDDGVRLWVNNQKVIDNWTNHPSTENRGTIQLNAGTKYDVRMEYYERGGRSEAQLLWSSPTKAKQVIPENRLYDR